MRIDRMLSITILLLSRDRVSATELASRFEVSVRTIYRDMEAINIAGIPIISYPGNDGGYGIMEGFKLDRQIFTTQDMISILSNLEGINNAFKSEPITQVIDKIHSLIPSNQKNEVKTSLNRMLIDIEPWGIKEQWKEMFKTIQRATENQKILEIKYVTADGKLSTRELEPMTLIFKSYAWYIWGYCLEKSDYRMFKISRIKDCKMVGKSFMHRGENYKEKHTSPVKIVYIKLRCDREFLSKSMELFPMESIGVVERDKFIVDISFPEGDWVKTFVMSLGPLVEVIEPKWLRDEIGTDTATLYKKYST